MLIDFDNIILSELVKSIRKVVGPYLSDLATPATNPPTLPAVIKAQTLDDQSAPIPDYPYITVDIGGLKDDGQWVMSDGVNTVQNTDYYFYEKYQMFRIEVMCFGKNSFGILRELKNSFGSDIARWNIFETPILNKLNQNQSYERFALSFHRSTEVNRIPTLEPTKYLNGAMFSFDYTLSEYVADVPDGTHGQDWNTGYYNKVILDGQYKYDESEPDDYTQHIEIGPM